MLTRKNSRELAPVDVIAARRGPLFLLAVPTIVAKLLLLTLALTFFFGALENPAVAEDSDLGNPSASPLLEFSDPDYNGRYRELIGELRCPKCQNQNLADSDAPIAKDLRSELVRLLEEGKDDQAILDFMTLRYGDFVRYRPVLSSYTVALWALPIFIFMLGVFVLLSMLRQRNTSAHSEESHMNNLETASGEAGSPEEGLLDERVKQLVERAHAER